MAYVHCNIKKFPEDFPSQILYTFEILIFQANSKRQIICNGNVIKMMIIHYKEIILLFEKKKIFRFEKVTTFILIKGTLAVV